MIKKLNSFSLIEVLLSILIISIILILLVPVVTMKKRKSDIQIRGNSAVFLFTKHNMPRNDEYLQKYWCMRPNFNISSDTGEPEHYITWSSFGQCQMYEFTVPKGVYRVNISMMGGGGGGGGAAGSIIYTKELFSPNKNSGKNITEKLLNVPKSRIKELKLNALVGKGSDGKSANLSYSTTTVYGGEGGKSGMGIFDSSILGIDVDDDLKVSLGEFDPKIDMSWIYQSDIDKIIAEEGATYYSGTDKLVSFPGIGFMLDMKKASGNYKDPDTETEYGFYGKKGYYVADQPIDKYQYILFYGVPYHPTTSLNFRRWIDTNGGYDPFQTWGVGKNRFVRPEFGKTSSLYYTGNIQNGFVVHGGEGAGYDYADLRIGEGGRGQSRQIVCGYGNRECTIPRNNTASANDYTTAKAINFSGDRYLSAYTNFSNFGHFTLTLEHPPGVGGGGAAGTFIRGLEFPVKPGTKYKIIVGAGGGGGNPGGQGSINSSGAIERQATPGHDGFAGSSSAIYDEDDNLIFLVTGGVGGAGGSVNSAAYTVPTAVQTTEADGSTLNTIDFANYAPNPSTPRSTRSLPVILRGKKLFDLHLAWDSNYIKDLIYDARGDESLGVSPTLIWRQSIINEYAHIYRVINANLYNTKAPYFALNANNPKTAMGEAVNVYNQADNDGNLGSFSAYRNDEVSSVKDLVLLNPTIEGYGYGSSMGVYSGLYFKYVDYADKFKLYAGGLGGISALGTKAGCGGLFVGNKEGLTNQYYRSGNYENTFGVPMASGNKSHFFITDDFFEGCNNTDPNGQTATFKAPQYTPDGGEYLGAAGAGGGGGGYSIKYGSGKGGDGQNGYVFITWTAPHN